ncbi:phenylalanine tRNA synthetase, beta subunit [Georgfuchsia toluolica]|uniref:Phenylalanine--tRNA ligase beta subunit n=1 Tax=Georgfuchsia toluolica TaxID=424218 RepID=A0A916J4Q5_9PROT|nr:phenylalanine--tRNA ligase subunit beta [Georgfuchsia toluolica]CAG4883922.1 phenylalanine tRNA synthetase, beta subunit [Georgfuchsia toluolica]
MQFSESWLRSFVNPSLDSEALSHLLTMAGLEVEEMHPVAPAFEKVVVAHVLSAEKHPDADKLKLCKVDVGQGDPLQIVCGAPNVAAGLRVPCALIGAKLPGIEIRQAKVRGIESFGMLCSAKELGIAADASGLLILSADAPTGKSVREVLDLDDRLFTIKLTPNRADCLSLSGVAREVAALTGASLQLPAIEPVVASATETRKVVLDAPAACPRYCGRVIRGIDAVAATPVWMRQRLERSGLRSISAVVDITNYVMLELGQPLHAFDDARLNGAIHVRYPAPDEALLLLNEQTIKPSADTLLIADEARVLALAGIMGGEDSGVTAATRDVFLESAFFAPAAIAGKARVYGFSSDASHRFERGVDFTLQRDAIERATQLILDICGGNAGPVVEAFTPEHLPQRPEVILRPQKLASLIGVDFTAAQIEGFLSKLGFIFRKEGNAFVVNPPARRFDIEIEQDLIEEVARLFGYDNIPARPPQASAIMLDATERQRDAMAVRHAVVACGYREVVNFSFVDAAWEADFCANTSPVTLANPIASQMSVMRSSLIGGLVANLSTNRKRQIERVRVFEIGRCFSHDDQGEPVPGFAQPTRLAGLCAGTALPEQWGAASRPIDFFDAKADVESLFESGALRWERASHPALHPGRAANAMLGGRCIGVVGELHPRWVQKYELVTAPVAFEIELDALLQAEVPAYRPVSNFPAVVRDVALTVDHGLAWQSLQETLRKAAPALVSRIELFDVYAGKGITEGRKSLAFRIVMQDTQRTLEDAEVDAVVASIVAIAEREFAAELRR